LVSETSSNRAVTDHIVVKLAICAAQTFDDIRCHFECNRAGSVILPKAPVETAPYAGIQEEFVQAVSLEGIRPSRSAVHNRIAKAAAVKR
jgi:hypothetical protein